MWEVMLWPIVAAILLPAILVYFGIHVIRREIIFVDLALAQMASLGVCFAVLFHFELTSAVTFAISLGFTLLGAGIFAFARMRRNEIPLEAIIGIAYVMAAAAAVLVLSRTPEGDEQIKNMLVGSILLVTPGEIAKSCGLFLAVGIFHAVYRKAFLIISEDPQKAREQGHRVRWWDFLFYATFGLVVTSFVRIAGVLLVFTYLIVPAVCGIRLGRGFSAQLVIGALISLFGGIAGLFVSYWFDFPSGAAIVCTFGALLVVLLAAQALARMRR